MKTEDEIRTVFDNLIPKIEGEFSINLDNTGLKFTDHRCSFCKMWENNIYFSMPAYKYDIEYKSTIEYKMVLRSLKTIPYFCDSCRDWRILTDEPEVWTLLHELSHIIVDGQYDDSIYSIKPHGNEFCNIYSDLINFIHPNVLTPFGGTFVWE